MENQDLRERIPLSSTNLDVLRHKTEDIDGHIRGLNQSILSPIMKHGKRIISPANQSNQMPLLKYNDTLDDLESYRVKERVNLKVARWNKESVLPQPLSREKFRRQITVIDRPRKDSKLNNSLESERRDKDRGHKKIGFSSSREELLLRIDSHEANPIVYSKHPVNVASQNGRKSRLKVGSINQPKPVHLKYSINDY